MKFLFSFFLIFQSLCLVAQPKRIVELSGKVMNIYGEPIAYANVLVKNKFRGTAAGFGGEFSLLVQTGDTVLFTAIGYVTERFFIPDTIARRDFKLPVYMQSDTFRLKGAVIRPWRNYEQFKQAFIGMKDEPETPEMKQINQAKRNLERIFAQEMANPSPMSGYANFRNYMQHKADKIYYAGQTAPNNYLNPIAWARFIESVKEKKKEKEKTKY